MCETVRVGRLSKRRALTRDCSSVGNRLIGGLKGGVGVDMACICYQEW